MRLQIRDVRSIADAALEPGAGLNLLLGPNGAGKTSVLEALHVLAYGRGFRGRVRDGLIRTGADQLQVVAAWEEGDGRQRRVGLEHAGNTWRGRLDGETVTQLGDLCAALAVTAFEPGSHALLAGPTEPRRRYLDWGLFHVEPAFLPIWRRHARALKQRNHLLKSGRASGSQLDAWDAELADAGVQLTRHREAYLAALVPHMVRWVERLVPVLGEAAVDYRPGWRRDQHALYDALMLARDRDLAQGHTSVGPHRADWHIAFAQRPADEALSRGQAKLASLAVLLAQAEDFRQRRGEWPIILLDDLASELDRAHRRGLLEALLGSGAQVFVTGTERAALDVPADAVIRVFHVEPEGRVQPAE